jgi:hypothetical protein
MASDRKFVLQKVHSALLDLMDGAVYAAQFPFLIPNITLALNIAYAVVLIELLLISVIRYKFMHTPLLRTIGQVIFGGGVVFSIGLWLGQFGAA